MSKTVKILGYVTNNYGQVLPVGSQQVIDDQYAYALIEQNLASIVAPDVFPPARNAPFSNVQQSGGGSFSTFTGASRNFAQTDSAVTLDCASGITLSIVAGTLTAAFQASLQLPATGNVTISWPAGVTVNGTAGPSTATRALSTTQRIVALIARSTANVFDLTGQ